MLFEAFESFTIETQSIPNVSIFGRKTRTPSSQSLPPLLLLHGFPQSHHCWHAVVPMLANKYDVVMMDLRGYGESSKPESVSQYAKSLMARDCAVVMSALGFESFFVCAHDRGARVAHKLCVDYPKRIRKAIFLDICPTLDMYFSPGLDMAKTYFHWFFLIQRAPFPETLIATNARKSAEMFLGGGEERHLDIFNKGCLEHYINRLGDDACIHAMCQEYRASASLDLDEGRQDLDNGKMVQCPLLVLWSKHGLIQRCFDPLTLWRAVAVDKGLVSGWALDSGHFIPEHAPLEVAHAIQEFLR